MKGATAGLCARRELLQGSVHEGSYCRALCMKGATAGLCA